VRTSGQVLLLTRVAVRSGHVQVDGLTVEAADVRGRVERPHGWSMSDHGAPVGGVPPSSSRQDGRGCIVRGG
jgi:hypothetical protein